jgi:general secretion pathway protein G
MTNINRAVRNKRKGQRGFTLIELLVVIAVLAVLAGIVIFNVTGVTNRGAASACSTDTKSVQTAVDAWTSDHSGAAFAVGAIADFSAAGLVPTYMHTAPTSCTSFTVGAGNLVTSTP